MSGRASCCDPAHARAPRQSCEPARHRARVRIEPLELRQSDGAPGPSARRPVRRELLHRDALDEIEHREPAVGARVAVGRQNVVGARAVIAHRLRRPGAEKHRARVRVLCSASARLAHLEDECSGAYSFATSMARLESGTTMQRLPASDCSRIARRESVARLRFDLGGDRLGERAARRSPGSPGPACRARPAPADPRRRSPRARVSSAITSTSEGPAGMSQAAPSGSRATSCLAAVTQALPGPKILSTLGTLSVP